MNKCIKVFVVLIIILLFFIFSINRYNNLMKNKLEKVNNLTNNMKVININDIDNIYDRKENSYILINDISLSKYDDKIIYLNKYVKKKKITLYYLEFSNLNDSEREKLYNSNDYFENGIVLPIILKVNDNEIIDIINIEESNKKIKEFF